VHRRNELKAEKIAQKRLFSNPKINVVWDSAVDEVLGAGTPPGVVGVRLKNVKTGATQELKIDGLFVAIGHTPNTELFKGVLKMDENGYLLTAPDSTRTNIPGVFAAGDVQDHVFRQAVTAAGTGCMAALEADRFIAEQGAH
jgi:thioredoxin reductase (NADPH)